MEALSGRAGLSGQRLEGALFASAWLGGCWEEEGGRSTAARLLQMFRCLYYTAEFSTASFCLVIAHAGAAVVLSCIEHPSTTTISFLHFIYSFNHST